MKYFKHDLNAFDDDKIWELIESQGMQGYGIWWWTLEQLYSAEESGFQIHASETWFKRASKAMNLTDWRTLVRALDAMSEIGLIDPQLWAEHYIYCPGIIKRADAYIAEKTAAKERKRRQRERAKALKEQESHTGVTRDVTPKTESHTTVLTRVDPDPDPDLSSPPTPSSELEGKEKKVLTVGLNQLGDNPGPHEYSPGLTPYQGSRQFMEDHPWINEWKGVRTEYKSEFVEFCKPKMAGWDYYREGVTFGDAENHIKKANFDTADGQKRLEQVYGWWKEYQGFLEKKQGPKVVYEVIETEIDRILRGGISA